MAARNPAYQATLLEKLDIIPGLLAMMGAGLYAAVAAPFRSTWGADTYMHHVTHAIVRKMCVRLNTAQLQYIGEPFSRIYEKWCKSKGFQPDIVTLKSGCKACWMGDKTAKYVVLYFHGGGFSLDGDDTHLNFWHTVQTDLASVNKSTAFLFVEYSLVPHATYPVQFREGVEALQYLLKDMGRSPSDIILAGDSAGGNMCLAILSHITHPSPDVPEIEVDTPLKGAVLVAPWVSFRTDWPSGERNKYKCIITTVAGEKWGQDYLAGKPTSPYAEAIEAPASWWQGAKVEQLLCVAGADEMLADPISEWVEKYQSVNPDTTTYLLAQNEIHIAPIIEPRFGDSTETEQGKTIKSWMKAKL